jgi:hypothetical protein
MSQVEIIGLAIGVPLVVGGLGYTLYRTMTTTPTQERNSTSSARSSESYVRRYPQDDDRESIVEPRSSNRILYGLSEETPSTPYTITSVGGKKTKNKKNTKNKTKRKK